MVRAAANKANQKPPAEDQRAEIEYSLFEKERLRSDQRRTVMHRLSIVAMIVVSAVLGVAWIIYVGHYFCSEKYRWLSEAQLKDMEKLFVGGVGGTVVATVVQKIVKSNEFQ